MGRNKIYEDDKLYGTLRNYVDFCVYSSYSKICYVGLENIPTDGATILAPNHCNAMMDPLVVLSMTRDKKVFVARADVFNIPIVAKFLRFLKIMPINRRRDGIRSVLKTDDTIRKSIEVLNNKVQFCILCEGTHRPKHSLLKIGKGIARVATGAYETMTDDSPVYVLPIGCEYGDYYRFRSTAHVKIGKPVNISEYIKSHQDFSEHDIMEGIRNMVDEAMREQIVYLPDDETYDATWALVKIGTAHIRRLRVKKRFEEDRAIVSDILAYKEAAPEEASQLLKEAEEFEIRRKKAKISISAISGNYPFLKALGGTVNFLVGLPFFLIYAVESALLWIAAEVLARRSKDKAFCNSLRCGSMVFLWPVLVIIWAVTFFCTLPPLWALAALLCSLPAPLVVYDYFELVRQSASRWRVVFNKDLKAEWRLLDAKLRDARKKIHKQ